MKKLTAYTGLIALALALPVLAGGISRLANGHPDLSGTYDVSTLTPLQRPKEFGDNLELTSDQADAIVETARLQNIESSKNRGPITDAPPAGGAPPVGLGEEFTEAMGAGSVGGYNNFWVDPGDDVFSVDGKFRTSIIVEPIDGRMPKLTDAAMTKAIARSKLRRPNDGTAWWLDVAGGGPYDGPENLGISERCIVGFTGAAPTFPSLYNNYKRIIQGDDHVMILIEMVHDARIVRMNSEHPPAEVKKWLGDSVGHWQGDTLVVDTTNFHPPSRQARGGSADMHVIERFTPQQDGNLLYSFTVTDPNVWTAPWAGEYVWRASEEKVYEYACHEGNYSMEGILRGARLLEADWIEQANASSGD